MLEEVIKLEKLRQNIEKSLNEAGSASDFIDRGNPNKKQLKDAQDLITAKNKEAESLKLEFHELLTQTPPRAVEEWISWHKTILQKILSEPGTDVQSKTRQHVARETLQAWEKVQQGEQEYVNINWHYLKDYEKEVETQIRKDSWKFWK